MRGAWPLVVVAIVSVSACVGTPNLPSEDEQTISVSSASLPSYLHDLTQKLPGVTLQAATEHHYRIPMRDGIHLDSWILVPNGVADPVPLVLEITPYYGGGSIKDCKVVEGVTDSVACLANQVNNLLTRGYALGFLSVRGTGASEGCFTQGGPQEGKDSAEAIEFLARQLWSNGRVGVIGLSYVGTTANDVWIEAPPSLKTVVSMAGITELYKYNFVNGVHIDPQGYSFNFYYWPIVGLGPAGIEGGTNTNPREIPNSYLHEACPDQVDVQQGGLNSALTGDYHGYWQVRNFSAEFLQDPNRPRPSMLYFMGLQDWNVKPHNMEPFYSHLKASGVPLFTLLSNQTHLWPLREDWSHEILVAWFDQFLKGHETGILDAPPVWLQDDEGVWRAEAAYPAADAITTRLYLGENNALAWTEPQTESAYTYREQSTKYSAAGGSQRVLRSEPLDEDLHLSHVSMLHLAARATGSRAVVSVTLGEQSPDGRIRTFNWAIQSLNHLNLPDKGRADVSGQRLEGWVPFFPQEDVVHKGNRIVAILSNRPVLMQGPGPGMDPFPSASDVTVFGKSSWIDLVSDPTIVPEDPQPKMLRLPRS